MEFVQIQVIKNFFLVDSITMQNFKSIAQLQGFFISILKKFMNPASKFLR
jgi:hypothetical protein